MGSCSILHIAQLLTIISGLELRRPQRGDLKLAVGAVIVAKVIVVIVVVVTVSVVIVESELLPAGVVVLLHPGAATHPLAKMIVETETETMTTAAVLAALSTEIAIAR